MARKPNSEEVVKVFKGLAIAAGRAKTMTSDFGKDAIRDSLSRRQQDAVRQSLLDIEADVQAVLQTMTSH